MFATQEEAERKLVEDAKEAARSSHQQYWQKKEVLPISLSALSAIKPAQTEDEPISQDDIPF